MKSAFAILFLLLLPLLFRGQTFQPHAINYSVEEGVPSSECYHVLQDSKGFIWIATDKGICKYNGYTFTKYTTEDGLPDNTVFGFFEDSKKRLWGRTGTALFYFENDSIHIPAFNDDLRKKLGPCIINHLYVTDDDSVFIETREIQLFMCHTGSREAQLHHQGKNTMRFFNKKGIVFWNHIPTGIKSVKSIDIQFACKNGLLQYALNTDGLIIPGQRTALKNGGFLFCFSKSLICYDEQDNKFSTRRFAMRVLSVFEDSDLGVWLGTLNDGIYYYPYGINGPVKHFFDKEAVTSFCEDAEGGIWISTLKSGIFYIANKKSMSVEFSKEAFNVIKKIDNEMIGGSKNGNVYFFDSTGVTDVTSLPRNVTDGNFIYDLYNFNKSTIIAGGSTVFLVDKKSHRPSLPPSEPRRMYTHGFASNGNPGVFYMYSYITLVTVNSHNFKVYQKNIGIPSRITTLHGLPDGTLLFGTVNGLYVSPDVKTFTHLAPRNKLLGYRINDIKSYGSKLLLATNKGVVYADLSNNIYKQVTETEGLSSNICQQICIDNDVVWVATNKGISILQINEDGFGSSISKIDKFDGLPGEEINCIYVDDTRAWIASNSGISYFSKSSFLMNHTQPRIYIGLLKTNKGVYKQPEEKLTFNYDENYLEIDFYGLSFRSLGHLKYKYKLSGIDEEWHYTSEPKIIYPSLSGGNYTFEVFAINNDGVCSALPAIVSFEVIPPFWQKLWFIIAMLLLVIFLAMLFFRYRINLVKDQELKNAELHKTFLNLKLKALRAQMNPHFTFNVMNSIQHFILTNDEDSAHRYMSKFSKLIRAILNNSEKNTIPVAEEIKALELYLELEAMRFDESFSYEIIIDKTIDPEVIGIPSMLIQPYVENAIMHGILPLKAKGKIKVEITIYNDLLKCVIEDNGIGRAKSAGQNKSRQHRSMGISLTAERLIVINELNSSNLSEKIIDLTDENGNASGTRVEIYIPIN